MNAHNPHEMRRPIISHGRTLTDIMNDDQVREYLERLDADKAIGVIRLAVLKTYAPDVFNVECWTDNIRPYSAILALEIAAKRLRELHDINPQKIPAVDNAETLREISEGLVDMIRKWETPDGRLPSFKLSREVAVMSVMGVIAGATGS